MYFTPFLVIDRPNLLTPAQAINEKVGIGLMSHTYASDNFKDRWRIKGIPTICDSGVFLKESYQDSALTYPDLFNRYNAAECDYGIMLDALGDREATIASAIEALKAYYANGGRTFKLIGVTQGQNPSEHAECAKTLLGYGFRHIAIGGMLKKVEASARFVTAEDTRLRQTIEAVREVWDGWLFCLGCFHPRRLPLFEEFNVWGADSKWWAFQCDGGLATEVRHSQLIDRFTQAIRWHYEQSGRAIALVSCVAEKLDHSAPAKNLYTSQLFIKAKRYIEAKGYSWAILSALHGLVEPDQLVAPYEYTLNRMDIKSRRLWAIKVHQQIKEMLPTGGLIRVFAGEAYRQFLIPLLKQDGYMIEVPLEGLKIGEQLAWYIRRTEEAEGVAI